MDHPESKQAIEDECSICHMPAVRMADGMRENTRRCFRVFRCRSLPKGDRAAADGVTCSVCHQIEKTGLGTDATFVGNVALANRSRTTSGPSMGPSTWTKATGP
jgi:hypothetical protein